jgi:hypothetical protein
VDGPRGPGGRSVGIVFVVCSSCSCSSSFSIRCDFEFWLAEVSHGPCVPGGQSAGAWRTVRVLLADGPLFGVRLCWFGVLFQIVRVWWSDGPRPLRGRSAGPTRTVRTGFCSSELVLRFLFVSFRFLSLGFLVVPLRLFEPCLGSCLCVWVRGVAIGV